MASPRTAAPPTSTASDSFWPVLLCWLAVALDGFDLVVLGAVIPTLSKTGDLGFTDASLTTASTVGLVGVGIGAVAIGPLTDRYGRRRSLISCIAIFSVFTHRRGLRPGRHAVHRPAVPRRPRPRRLPADRARVHVRARPDGQQQQGRHPDDDRLPRRRGADRAAGPVARRGLRLGVDVRGRRRARPADPAADVGEAARVRGLPRAPSSDGDAAPGLADRRRRAAAATCGSASASGSRRSWGCCWSTGSTPGCPRSWARPATRIQAGTTLLLVLNVGAVIGLLVAGVLADARGNKKIVLLWFGLAAVFLVLLSDQARGDLARVRRGAAHRHLRVQRAGAGVRVRRSPLPARGPRHRPRHGGRRRPGRRDRRPLDRAARSSPPESPTRGASTPSRSPPCWRWSRSPPSPPTPRFRWVEDDRVAGNTSTPGASVTSRAWRSSARSTRSTGGSR